MPIVGYAAAEAKRLLAAWRPLWDNPNMQKVATRGKEEQ
jgi:hypothetical protein